MPKPNILYFDKRFLANVHLPFLLRGVMWEVMLRGSWGTSWLLLFTNWCRWRWIVHWKGTSSIDNARMLQLGCCLVTLSRTSLFCCIGLARSWFVSRLVLHFYETFKKSSELHFNKENWDPQISFISLAFIFLLNSFLQSKSKIIGIAWSSPAIIVRFNKCTGEWNHSYHNEYRT